MDTLVLFKRIIKYFFIFYPLYVEMFEVSCHFLLFKQSNVTYTCYEIMTNVLNRRKKDDISLLHSDRNPGNDIARS